MLHMYSIHFCTDEMKKAQTSSFSQSLTPTHTQYKVKKCVKILHNTMNYVKSICISAKTQIPQLLYSLLNKTMDI